MRTRFMIRSAKAQAMTSQAKMQRDTEHRTYTQSEQAEEQLEYTEGYADRQSLKSRR